MSNDASWEGKLRITVISRCQWRKTHLKYDSPSVYKSFEWKLPSGNALGWRESLNKKKKSFQEDVDCKNKQTNKQTNKQNLSKSP